MQKLLALLLGLGLIISINAYADSCKDISNNFTGQWEYTFGSERHVIEFSKDSSLVKLDGNTKQTSFCLYLPKFNSINFGYINDFNRFNLERDEDGVLLITTLRDSSPLIKVEDKSPVEIDSRVVTSNEMAVADTFGWETRVVYDGHIFPSWLISTARLTNNTASTTNKLPKNVELMGDDNGMFIVGIKNVKDNMPVKIELDIGQIARVSVFEGVLTKAGTTYIIRPKVNYDYQYLLDIKQPIPLNAKFTLYMDGVRVAEQLKTITVHSINDAPIASLNKETGVTTRNQLIFAAFVNENNPTIDTILREAIDTGEIGRFIGYQGTQTDVQMQVYAIWNALQRRGIKYSSITTPTAVSSEVYSQYVRFFDDSLINSQANCVDGTVLFASILRRIGIAPKLMLKPGHMFLAYELVPNSNKLAFLETTIIGNADLGAQVQNVDDKLSKALHVKSYKNTQSLNSFLYASKVGRAQAIEMLPKLNNGKDNGYLMIDIQTAREAGIASINH